MTEKTTYTNIHDIEKAIEHASERLKSSSSSISGIQQNLTKSATAIASMSQEDIQATAVSVSENNVLDITNLTTVSTLVPIGSVHPVVFDASCSAFNSEEDRILRETKQQDIIRLVKEERKRTDDSLNRIVCAANRPIVDGVPCEPVILGPRHWDDTMRKTYDLLKDYLDLPPHSQFEQGFVDIKGEFKTRAEAWPIALAAGQIIFRCGGDTVDGGTLYSDNMY